MVYLFFGSERENARQKEQRERLAKAVCRRCVVIETCLEKALARKEMFGVWGGMGEDELQALARRKQRPIGGAAAKSA